jgi:ATP-dependent exoDNAse (exonuclease V) alpha subunit
MTSYSSQAATVDRVLLHIDVDQPGTLVNDRLAYVGPSRAREDVQIFTNDQTDLGRVLSREHSHESTLDLDDTRQHARAVSTPGEQLQMPGGF